MPDLPDKTILSAALALCAALLMLPPSPAGQRTQASAFALAPASRGGQKLASNHKALFRNERKADAREIANMALPELPSLNRLPRLLMEITYFEDQIPASRLISRKTKDRIAAFMEEYNDDGDYVNAISALHEEMNPMNAANFEFSAHIGEINRAIGALLTAIAQEKLSTDAFDPTLKELSGGRFLSVGQMNKYWKEHDNSIAIVDVRIDPSASRDAVLYHDEINPTEKYFFVIRVKSSQAMLALNSHSEYIAALMAALRFPDMGLPDGYDLPGPDGETPSFAPFIRLFYDYAVRAANGVRMNAPYTEYHNGIKARKNGGKESDYALALKSQQMNDRKGYFRLLNLKPDSTNQEIRINYQRLRRQTSPALISPKAKEWFEKESRRQRLDRLTEAYDILINPHRRVLYDPAFRRKHPQLFFESAA